MKTLLIYRTFLASLFLICLFPSLQAQSQQITIEYSDEIIDPNGENEINLFPNPILENATLQIPQGISPTQLIIRNQSGEIVELVNLEGSSLPTSIQTNLNDGVYYVVVVGLWGIIRLVFSTAGIGIGGTGVRPAI